MSKFTRDDLRRLGYVPDGKGKMIKLDDAPVVAAKAASKVRMNSVEKRWFAELQARHPSAVIIPQFRMRVGAFDQPNAVHYTADFAVWHESMRLADHWHCTLWECKDKRRPYHSDELTRPKLVRQQNPFVGQVMLATWTGTEWEERVLA